VLRDIEIIKRELPVDMLEFFFLTPLPGSEDHRKLLAEGAWMDPDLNKYDLYHRVSHHPKMSDDEWDKVYHEAWLSYYSPDHIKTVLRRAAACSKSSRLLLKMRFLLSFYLMYTIEGLHPLEGGIFRRKYRLDRRPGMAVESRLTFYPSFAFDTLRKLGRYITATVHGHWLYWRLNRDPAKRDYTDLAITPPKADEHETLELFQNTSGGSDAVERKLKEDRVRVKVEAKVA